MVSQSLGLLPSVHPPWPGSLAPCVWPDSLRQTQGPQDAGPLLARTALLGACGLAPLWPLRLSSLAFTAQNDQRFFYTAPTSGFDWPPPPRVGAGPLSLRRREASRPALLSGAPGRPHSSPYLPCLGPALWARCRFHLCGGWGQSPLLADPPHPEAPVTSRRVLQTRPVCCLAGSSLSLGGCSVSMEALLRKCPPGEFWFGAPAGHSAGWKSAPFPYPSG